MRGETRVVTRRRRRTARGSAPVQHRWPTVPTWPRRRAPGGGPGDCSQRGAPPPGSAGAWRRARQGGRARVPASGPALRRPRGSPMPRPGARRMRLPRTSTAPSTASPTSPVLRPRPRRGRSEATASTSWSTLPDTPATRPSRCWPSARRRCRRTGSVTAPRSGPSGSPISSPTPSSPRRRWPGTAARPASTCPRASWRPPGRRRAHAASPVARSDCRRTVSSSPASTGTTSSTRACSCSGCACWRTCRTPCSGCARGRIGRTQISGPRPCITASIPPGWSSPSAGSRPSTWPVTAWPTSRSIPSTTPAGSPPWTRSGAGFR